MFLYMFLRVSSVFLSSEDNNLQSRNRGGGVGVLPEDNLPPMGNWTEGGDSVGRGGWAPPPTEGEGSKKGLW